MESPNTEIIREPALIRSLFLNVSKNSWIVLLVALVISEGFIVGSTYISSAIEIDKLFKNQAITQIQWS